MQSERGGGFIVAVSRTFCCTVIRLLNDDSLLDQLALTVSGSSGKISIVASYVPPGNDSGLFQAHLDNIFNIHARLEGSDGSVAGDFNLSSVFWTCDPRAFAMVPGYVHHSHEIIVINDCFSMRLTQIASIFNDLHKLLNSIFTNSIVRSNVTLAEFTISNCVVHYKPLFLIIVFYSFLPFIDSNPRYIFDSSSLISLRDCLLSWNWGALLWNSWN